MLSGGINVNKNIFKCSQKNRPLISIITIVFNGESHIESTILSVVNHTYDNLEYIIIDGGSTDKTIDIIKKYDHLIDFWISEKDKGISNAFNKGISFSNGYKVLLLNSGDTFSKDSIISDYIQLISEDSDITFFVAKVTNKIFIPSSTTKFEKKLILQNLEIPHQAAFVKKSVYQDLGLYNENFKIRMDYDFFLRARKENLSFDFHNDIFVNYLPGGISMRFSNRFLFNFEKIVSDYYNTGNWPRSSFLQKMKYIISFLFVVLNKK